MKKIILVAVMSVFCTAAFAQKFAHINSQEVFQLMPEMDEARTQIDAMVKDNQDVLKSMYDEYQTKLQTYQQKAATWTPSIKESKEKELMELENRINETQQSMQQEMQTIQNNITAPIMKKCTETIQKIAKEGGYIYVFDIASALYIDPAQSVDLTSEVRKALGIPADRTLEKLQAELQAKQQQEQAAN